jgi:hypothetical protein
MSKEVQAPAALMYRIAGSMRFSKPSTRSTNGIATSSAGLVLFYKYYLLFSDMS